MQIHHIIPKEIITSIQNPNVRKELLSNNDFLIELPCSEQEAKKRNLYLFHQGSHDNYTKQILNLLGHNVNRKIDYYRNFSSKILNCINYHLKYSDDGQPVNINDILVEEMTKSEAEDYNDYSIHTSDSDVF